LYFSKSIVRQSASAIYQLNGHGESVAATISVPASRLGDCGGTDAVLKDIVSAAVAPCKIVLFFLMTTQMHCLRKPTVEGHTDLAFFTGLEFCPKRGRNLGTEHVPQFRDVLPRCDDVNREILTVSSNLLVRRPKKENGIATSWEGPARSAVLTTLILKRRLLVIFACVLFSVVCIFGAQFSVNQNPTKTRELEPA